MTEKARRKAGFIMRSLGVEPMCLHAERVARRPMRYLRNSIIAYFIPIANHVPKMGTWRFPSCARVCGNTCVPIRPFWPNCFSFVRMAFLFMMRFYKPASGALRAHFTNWQAMHHGPIMRLLGNIPNPLNA